MDNRNHLLIFILALGVFGILNTELGVVGILPLIARVIPAFLHPVYISIALTVASTSVPKEEVRKAVSKVILGVSAGMVLGVPIATFIANQTSLKMAMICCR